MRTDQIKFGIVFEYYLLFISIYRSTFQTANQNWSLKGSDHQRSSIFVKQTCDLESKLTQYEEL
jgi:hypothetical protein